MADISAIETAIGRLALQLNSIYLGARFADFPKDTAKSRLPLRLLIPTSNYAFGTWQQDEDIHLVCLSEDRQETFWHIVGEAVLEQETKLAVPRDCQFNLTHNLRLEELLGDGQVILHHCRAPETFDLQLMREYGVPLYTESLPRSERNRLEQDVRGAMLQAVVKKHGQQLQHETAEGDALGRIHDTTQLLGRFGRQDLEDWKTHHTEFYDGLLCMRRWAVRNGVLHRSFGFMDADTLLWLVYHDHAEYHTPEVFTDEQTSVTRTRHYLRQFSSRCCRFAFDVDGDSMRLKLTTPSGRRPAKDMSYLGVQALSQGIQRLNDLGDVDESGKQISTAMLVDGAELFAGIGDIYVKLYVECLRPESRSQVLSKTLPAVVSALGATLKQRSGVRLWPRAIEEDCVAGMWTYVLAVKWDPPVLTTPGQLAPLVVRALEDVEYDRTAVVFRSVFSRPADVEAIMVPASSDKEDVAIDMPDSTQVTDPADFSNNAESAEPRSDIPHHHRPRHLLLPDGQNDPAVSTQLPASHAIPRKPLPARPSPTLLEANIPRQRDNDRFRTAAQTVARLRWDPAHMHTAYEVGYLDRFEGLKWMDLEAWGNKATEEEDFVPEHRIRMFRRKGDGLVVWSREERVDAT